ncbi:telomerase reverse transcriptase [Candoia aspera]|uniref:telomerase reverse transcriptase n=1 Tax=Candoia aspera TaxID=51853 RepID=UPI002FD7C1A7
MERSRRWRAVRELLRSFYAEVLPLEAFVRRLQMRTLGEEQPEPLVQDGDPRNYCNLVAQCLVGRLAACKAVPAHFVFQQVSSQNDVFARVIRRICEKKKKNVLAFGYTLLNESNYQLPCMPNICSYQPNNTTETIRQSVLWEIILNRVGDDVMMYILEHCALFILVPPSCCYQICGQPIYELALRNATPPPKFLRQRIPGSSPCVLTTYLHKRFQTCRQYPRKTKWKKWNSERQRWNETRQYSDQLSLVAQRASGRNPTKNKQIMGTGDYIKKQQITSLCPSLRTQFLKRKGTGQCNISAKKIKIMIKEEDLKKDTNPVSIKSRNQLILDCGSNDASSGCIQLRSERLTLVKSVPQNSGAQMSGVPSASIDNQGVLMHEKQESKIPCESSLQSTCNARLPKLVTRISDVSSVQLGPAKNPLPEKDLEACTSKSVRKSYNSIPVTHIERHSLLYSCQHLKECLPKSFVLNHLKGHPAGGRHLVEKIFFSSKILKQPGSSSTQSSPKKKKRFPKRYWQMRNVFQELLQNHARCPYQVILKKNCPISVPESDKIGIGEQTFKQKGHQAGRISSRTQQVNAVEGCIASRSDGMNPFSETGTSSRSSERTELFKKEAKEQFQDSPSSHFMALLRQYSSHWQVYTFVRECLERVVPPALWGSNHNKCRFYKNVKKFISLGKFAMFSLEELTWKMRVSDCAWLRLTKESGHFVPASEHRFREELMSKFLYWLTDCYVSELLRCFFYITETTFQKNLLFFFRKAVWSKLQSIGIRSHLAKVQLCPLLKEEIEVLQQRKCVPLASKLRFIPKPNGLRPVVKLNSVVGAETFYRKSRGKKAQRFNVQLKNIFSVLNYERMKNPALLGSSVFGKEGIYAVWKKFVSKVLESNAEMPRFYFVKADVTGAYDTLPHNKLIEVILQALAPDRNTTYSIRRYAVIMRSRSGCVRRLYKRHVSTNNEFISGMKQFVSHLQQSTSVRNAVIVEQSVSLKESSSSLCEFFLQLIHNNILKIEDRYYVQRCGIPQGSILSTLLCNFCYGDMENKLLCNVQKDGVLMRLTDDFLLVTPHLAQAKTFLRTLTKGIPEYGFVINPSKTVVNFPVDEHVPGCLEFKQLPAHCVIPWCGLLINTQTLEIYCDYSSYACTSIRSSLSFNFTRKAGVNMRNKLLAVLQLKCHPLFIDLQINSLKTVCINIYKILLLQAYRFHACVLQLPFHQHIKNNPSFFLMVISDSASCCFSVLKAKNADSIPLTYKVVQWLSYHAFSTKLANHRVIYKCLLVPLKQCKIRLIRQIPEATMRLLSEVTKPSLYEDFEAILD